MEKDKIHNIDIYVWTTLPTIEILKEYKNWPDALFLYFSYIKQCRIQKTNQCWSTDKFMMKLLNWGKTRFLNAKSILKEIWLIEVVNYKQEWLIKKWFVKVNYLIKSPEPWFPPSENQETNASSKEYIKCLKKRKDNTQKIKQVDFCVSKILKYFSHLSSKEEILQEFKYRKSIKKICEIIEIMEQIIEELWIDENDDFYIDKKNINRMDIIIKEWLLESFFENDWFYEFSYNFWNRKLFE